MRRWSPESQGCWLLIVGIVYCVVADLNQDAGVKADVEQELEIGERVAHEK